MELKLNLQTALHPRNIKADLVSLTLHSILLSKLKLINFLPVAFEQALYLGLYMGASHETRDFGREPREDWGGDELGSACRHDWRIFISTSPGRSKIPLAENDMHQSIFAGNWNFRGECRNVLNRTFPQVNMFRCWPNLQTSRVLFSFLKQRNNFFGT